MLWVRDATSSTQTSRIAKTSLSTPPLVRRREELRLRKSKGTSPPQRAQLQEAMPQTGNKIPLQTSTTMALHLLEVEPPLSLSQALMFYAEAI